MMIDESLKKGKNGRGRHSTTHSTFPPGIGEWAAWRGRLPSHMLLDLMTAVCLAIEDP
jgi:hypothetical protein